MTASVEGMQGKSREQSGADSLFAERLAEPPRPPHRTPGVLQKQKEAAAYVREREALERRSVLRGLLWLAIVVLVFSLVRAGLDRAFYAGWWRQW